MELVGFCRLPLTSAFSRGHTPCTFQMASYALDESLIDFGCAPFPLTHNRIRPKRGSAIALHARPRAPSWHTRSADNPALRCRYAIEKRNYKRAVSILEALPMTLETEAMWNNLAQMALHDKFFMIAERCAGVARRTSAPPTARRRRHSAGLVSRVVAVLGPTLA